MEEGCSRPSNARSQSYTQQQCRLGPGPAVPGGQAHPCAALGLQAHRASLALLDSQEVQGTCTLRLTEVDCIKALPCMIKDFSLIGQRKAMKVVLKVGRAQGSHSKALGFIVASTAPSAQYCQGGSMATALLCLRSATWRVLASECPVCVAEPATSSSLAGSCPSGLSGHSPWPLANIVACTREWSLAAYF